MAGDWPDFGKPRMIPDSKPEPTGRYRQMWRNASPEVIFGWLSICETCGAVVGDEGLHDHFHAA